MKKGHKVTVVTTPYEKSDIVAKKFITRLSVKGIDVIVIDLADSNRFSVAKRGVRALGFSFISIWYAATLHYDVCISSSGPITVGLPMIYAKAIRHRKTVFEVRDLWPAGGIELGLIKSSWKKNLSLWFEKLCYRSADIIITASIGQKRHIFQRFDHLKIEVITHPSNIDLFAKYKIEESLPSWAAGKKIFTYIGSMGLIHNTTYWLNVAKELKIIDKEKTISFVLIGDGRDRELLISEKEKFGLENIFFLKLKPKRELSFWLDHSIGTLFATLDNPIQDTCSPNKIYDSFAAGRPVVQTSKGWIKELIEKENCGINVSLDNPKEAAYRIKLLAEDENTLKTMSINALRLAATTFNSNRLANSYLNLICKI
ncbi:putative glycosyl transferase [compost metagenome]